MIRNLKIKNLGPIKEADISFKEGLSALTGETGAGKSMIAEALSFLFGLKPYAAMIKDGEDFVEAEGVFFDGKEEISVKRRFDRSLKSSAFINQKSAALYQLKDLGLKMADFQGQNHSHEMFSSARQLEMIDNFAGLGKAKSEFEDLFKKKSELKEKIENLSLSASEKQRLLELYSYELKSIEDLSLNPAKDGVLSEAIAVLKNKDKINSALNEAFSLLEEDSKISGALDKAILKLEAASSLDASLADIPEKLRQAKVILEESVSFLKESAASQDYSQSEIDKMIDRDEKIKKLKKKYDCDLQGILEKAEELKGKLLLLSDNESDLDRLNKEFAFLKDKLFKAGRFLHEKRAAVLKDVSKLVLKELKDLGFEKPAFSIDLEYPLEEAHNSGFDRAEFLFSANPDQMPRPLRLCASGGEISRLVLAFKTIFFDKKDFKTMVLDEIDSGVGGNTIFSIGEKLKKISQSSQIITITHSASLAAFADYHYRVDKKINKGKTLITIELLFGEERQDEIARMLGSKFTKKTALEHAAELIRSASRVGL